MPEEKDIHIDYQGIIQQITDKAIVDLVNAFLPDDNHRKIMAGIVAVHRKYGIDAATSMKIILDLAEVLKEENETEWTPKTTTSIISPMQNSSNKPSKN